MSDIDEVNKFLRDARYYCVRIEADQNVVDTLQNLISAMEVLSEMVNNIVVTNKQDCEDYDE